MHSNIETLSPLKPEPLSRQAERALLSWIHRERLQPGESLPSTDAISRQLGVSRVVIREALQSLSARGVLEIGNGRRARVKPVTTMPLVHFFEHLTGMQQSDLGEFTEVRIALETRSAALAAVHHEEEDLARLQSILTEMDTSLDSPERFTALDIDFHITVAKASGNRLLLHLIESVRRSIETLMREGLARRRNRQQLQAVCEYHRAVFETIASGDPEAARQAMSDHFDTIARSLGRE